MDADTKKREPGCMCHQEEGDSACPVHDPPVCERCHREYTMEWPHTEPTRYCDPCAHAVADEVAAKLAAAEARADKAEGEVRYLREHREWLRARHDDRSVEHGPDGHALRLAWDAANPEPQPPPGVEP